MAVKIVINLDEKASKWRCSYLNLIRFSTFLNNLGFNVFDEYFIITSFIKIFFAIEIPIKLDEKASKMAIFILESNSFW